MRSYSAVSSPFDDGSQVEGLAWGDAVSSWVAMALAFGGSGGSPNLGKHISCTSVDDTTWVAAGTGQLPTWPAEVSDVVFSDFWTEFFSAGRWSPPQLFGEWTSVLGTSWSRLGRATSATFETAICVAPLSSLYGGTTVIGGELDTASGRQIASGSFTGPFTIRSTPINNQKFRVAQIAYDFTFDKFVAALTPVGVVSSPERIMISADGGTTWSLQSSPLDGTAAYGVCYSPTAPGVFVTGLTSIVFSNGGDTAGTWTQFNAPVGVHTGGKPCDAGTNVVVPGGDTNDLSEFDYGTSTFASLKLSLMVAAKVAGYRPASGGNAERVVVGGLGSPAGALYASIVAPSLLTHFDLG